MRVPNASVQLITVSEVRASDAQWLKLGVHGLSAQVRRDRVPDPVRLVPCKRSACTCAVLESELFDVSAAVACPAALCPRQVVVSSEAADTGDTLLPRRSRRADAALRRPASARFLETGRFSESEPIASHRARERPAHQHRHQPGDLHASGRGVRRLLSGDLYYRLNVIFGCPPPPVCAGGGAIRRSAAECAHRMTLQPPRKNGAAAPQPSEHAM